MVNKRRNAAAIALANDLVYSLHGRKMQDAVSHVSSSSSRSLELNYTTVSHISSGSQVPIPITFHIFKL